MEETYKNYVKKELLKEFEKTCKQNSLDFYSCGCILTAHIVMRDLMAHTFKGVWKDKKMTPKEAWESAMEQTDYHSGFSAAMTANIIATFSVRGNEFKKWWNKYNGGTGEEKGTLNPAILEIK